LIPAGTGIRQYHQVSVKTEEEEIEETEAEESISNIFQENA
jgi:hypothetical protein